MRWYRLAIIWITLMVLVLPVPALAQGGESVPDFIARAPQSVAIVCRQASAPGSGVNHNTAAPFPLAETGNLVILAEYARQVEQGLVSPQEPVSLDNLNRYNLPNIDGGAHQRFLSRLAPGTTTITLADVADGMLQYGSYAAADYLLMRLGSNGFNGFGMLHASLGLTTITVPTTYLGLYLAMSNHETGAINPAAVSRDQVVAEAARLRNLYLNDPNWQTAEIAYRQARNAGLPTLDQQAQFLARFGMQGSAQDITTLLSAAYDGRLSPTIQTVMQRHLNWPLRVNPALTGQYTQYGLVTGAWPGILTASYYVTTVTGDTQVMTVFYRDVPTASWAEWASSYSYKTLEEQALTGGCGVFNALLTGS